MHTLKISVKFPVLPEIKDIEARARDARHTKSSHFCMYVHSAWLPDGDDMRVNGDFIQHRTLRLLRSNDRDENIE